MTESDCTPSLAERIEQARRMLDAYPEDVFLPLEDTVRVVILSNAIRRSPDAFAAHVMRTVAFPVIENLADAAAVAVRERDAERERLDDSWYTDIGHRLDAVTEERDRLRDVVRSLARLNPNMKCELNDVLLVKTLEAAPAPERPERCPMCDSDDPEMCWRMAGGLPPIPHRMHRARNSDIECCPDPFHTPPEPGETR